MNEIIKIKIFKVPMMKTGHSFEFNKFKTVKIPPDEPESKPSPIKHQQTDCKKKPANAKMTEAYLNSSLVVLVE